MPRAMERTLWEEVREPRRLLKVVVGAGAARK